ncbi:MAG: hypothetical protein D6682_06690 [Zetaproteobacteria bacterium]|nr:MAG: hypothetical protein D6682_06690 [Zetaproteobacteria bacterium]
MTPLLPALPALAGILLNLITPPTIVVPDWGWAVAVAALAARRHHWLWALPLLLLHDLLLYQEARPLLLPAVAIGLLLVLYIDRQSGPALPQRLLMVIVAATPLAAEGWSPRAIALSLLFAIPLWHGIRDREHTGQRGAPPPSPAPDAIE